MARAIKPTRGVVGVVLSLVGSALQYAYTPEEHPLVVAGAKWLVWIGVALLLWWGFGWGRERMRRPTPQPIAPPTIANIAQTLPMFVQVATVVHTSWHATASTAGGDALPSLEGLLISLRHDNAVPAGTYLCDVMMAGNRARATVGATAGVAHISAVYPREFSEGDTVSLPLHPGTHHAAWRVVNGPTSDFLVGLDITVDSHGKVTWDERHDDPMKG